MASLSLSLSGIPFNYPYPGSAQKHKNITKQRTLSYTSTPSKLFPSIDIGRPSSNLNPANCNLNISGLNRGAAQSQDGESGPVS